MNKEELLELIELSKSVVNIKNYAKQIKNLNDKEVTEAASKKLGWIKEDLFNYISRFAEIWQADFIITGKLDMLVDVWSIEWERGQVIFVEQLFDQLVAFISTIEERYLLDEIDRSLNFMSSDDHELVLFNYVEGEQINTINKMIKEQGQKIDKEID